MIIEVGKLDLQSTFSGRCALTKYFENQAGAVDYLALEFFLKISLLNGRKRTVDDDEFSVRLVAGDPDPFDLTFANTGADGCAPS